MAKAISVTPRPYVERSSDNVKPTSSGWYLKFVDLKTS